MVKFMCTYTLYYNINHISTLNSEFNSWNDCHALASSISLNYVKYVTFWERTNFSYEYYKHMKDV